VSYQHAAEDIEYFTGIQVSRSAQQRLVHCQDFALPQAGTTVEELSVDGGNIRIRTPEGEPCSWKGYKAVCLHDQAVVAASFRDNAFMINWVNAQPLASVLTCIGDGHDGRAEHCDSLCCKHPATGSIGLVYLMENLHKVGGSLKWLDQAESLLWQGQVEAARALFANCKRQLAQNFCEYLDKHRHRIINYQYYQAEQICSIGSGAVESTIKQIDRRTKISGAQWEQENVPQVLAHRCAYLNGLISV
jgi:hypothetical protein